MKKLLLSLALSAICATSAFADESSYTLTIEKESLSGLTQGTDKIISDKSNEAIQWTFSATNASNKTLYTGWDNTKGFQFGSGSIPANTLTITSDGFSDKKISHIIINTSGASKIDASLSVKVGDTTFTNNNSASYSLTASATDVTFDGDEIGEISISYVNSSSKAIYIKSIKVIYEEAEVDPTPKVCATPTFSATEIYAGETVTITSTPGSTIHYEIGDNMEEGESPVTVTFSEVGTYEIYAIAYKEGYTDSEGVTTTITVTEKPELPAITGKWVMANTLVDGGIYIIAAKNNDNWYAMSTTVNTNNINGIAVENSDAIITSNDNTALIRFEQDGNNWAMYLANAGDNSGYLTCTSNASKNYMTTKESKQTVATISINENTGVATIKYTSTTSTATTTRTQMSFNYNNGTPIFSCYSSQQSEIYIFEPYAAAPVAPAAPEVLINGEPINPDEEIDLNGGSVTVTLTAEEGHHIYHKHVAAVAAAADYYFDGEEADDEHAGFTKVENHTADVTVDTNGTLTFYAHNPETNAKSVPVSLNFVNDVTTSLSEIEAAGRAEYFDMQGRRVAAPANGIFIRREGSRTAKVRL